MRSALQGDGTMFLNKRGDTSPQRFTVEMVLADIEASARDLAFWRHFRVRPDVERQDAYVKSGIMENWRSGHGISW
jgi:hypothetical protein